MLNDGGRAQKYEENDNFTGLTARALYLEMRKELIDQTNEFILLNCQDHPYKGMNYQVFRKWLDLYPFIRVQIRESMVPRLWTLKNEYAVPPVSLEKVKKFDAESSGSVIDKLDIEESK